MPIQKPAADRRRRHGRQRRPRQTASAGATGLAARYKHSGLAASKFSAGALPVHQRVCWLSQSPQVRFEYSSDYKLCFPLHLHEFDPTTPLPVWALRSLRRQCRAGLLNAHRNVVPLGLSVGSQRSLLYQLST